MKVYRVYENYHSDDEAGTLEYGTYSSLEKAQARLAAMWLQSKYPDPKPEDVKDSGWYANDGWDGVSINVQCIVVDEDRNDNRVVFT